MKKIISIILMLFVTMILTACQPTPQKPVVENKNDGELEQAIVQTAAPTVEPKETAEQPQEIRINDTKTNDAGTVTVNIDAGVKLVGDEKITVTRMEQYAYTEKDMDRIIAAFFGDDLTFYDPWVTTKADLEKHIIFLQRRMTNEEEMLHSDFATINGITDIEKIRSHLRELIEEDKKKMADVPEKRPVIENPDFFNNRGLSVAVDIGEDYMGRAGYSSPTSRRTGIYCNAFGGKEPEKARILTHLTATPVDEDDDNPELQKAKQVAQKFMDDTGIVGVRMGDICKSLDNVMGRPMWGNIDEVVVSDREFYVFCFERVVGDKTLDYTFYRGDLSLEDYDRPVPYEKLEVWVEGSRVVQFSWSMPAKVTDIINENTAVQINYEQALDLAVSNLFSRYTRYFERGEAKSIAIDISGLEFEMVRIKEKDTSNHMIIPAWKIYGDVQMKYTEEVKNKLNKALANHPDKNNPYCPETIEDYTSLEYCPNIVTVNALDGSIIDMEKGY